MEADLDMLVSGNFGMGVSFVAGQGTTSTYYTGASSYTGTTQSTSTFGLRVFFKTSRSFVTASIGPIIGVIANSSSTKVTAAGSTTTNPAVYTTQFAIGFGVSIDIAIFGPLALTASPSILLGVGGAPNMTVINAIGGLSYNF